MIHRQARVIAVGQTWENVESDGGCCQFFLQAVPFNLTIFVFEVFFRFTAGFHSINVQAQTQGARVCIQCTQVRLMEIYSKCVKHGVHILKNVPQFLWWQAHFAQKRISRAPCLSRYDDEYGSIHPLEPSMKINRTLDLV